ncbi:hypothetical protein ACP275_08G116100 [Erythranthe tilingii]
MKNLGEVNYFLGLEVEKSNSGFFISQRRYANDLLRRFGIGESKEKAAPMEPHLKLRKDEGKLLTDSRKFRQLVVPNLDAARRILRYVKGSLDHGLLYTKSDTFRLSSFTDADWAGDVNDRHSTSGYCFNTGSAMVSWCSKKQSVVALSSSEAEYVAATMAAQECIWLKSLLGDLFCKVEYAVKIKCDNESAIKLASNPNVLKQEIELEKVATSEQVADIFTKALAKPKFEYFIAALGVVDRKYALRGSVEN